MVTYKAKWYGITKENCNRFLSDYDFYNPERVEIEPYKLGDNPVLVKTGVKAYMGDNEFLMLVNRSSNPKKKKLQLSVSNSTKKSR